MKRLKKDNYIIDKIQFEIEWNFKKIFQFFLNAIKRIFVSFFETIRQILLKTLKMIMIVTNILFLFSVLMLFNNIGEMLSSGTKFTSTRYFVPMIWIMGIHFMVVFFSNLLNKKY